LFADTQNLTLVKTKDFSLHKSLILNRKVIGRNKHQNWTHYLTSINFIPLSVNELHVKIYLMASARTIGIMDQSAHCIQTLKMIFKHGSLHFVRQNKNYTAQMY